MGNKRDSPISRREFARRAAFASAGRVFGSGGASQLRFYACFTSGAATRKRAQAFAGKPDRSRITDSGHLRPVWEAPF